MTAPPVYTAVATIGLPNYVHLTIDPHQHFLPLTPWYNAPAMVVEAVPLEPHTVHSDRLIRHAYEQLEKGDRLQASEKAWGAVAHRLKIVADHRSIPYKTHRDVFDLQNALIREYPNPRELESLFGNAHELHQNYYVDSVPIWQLRRQLDLASELLDILERPEYSGHGVVADPGERQVEPSTQPVEVVVSSPTDRPTTVVREGQITRITVDPAESTQPQRRAKPKKPKRPAYMRPGERSQRSRKGRRRK